MASPGCYSRQRLCGVSMAWAVSPRVMIRPTPPCKSVPIGCGIAMAKARAFQSALAAPRPPARWCSHKGSNARGCRGRERVGQSSWTSVWSGCVASGVRSIRGTWHQNRCLTPKRIWSQALRMSNRRHRAWEWSDHTRAVQRLRVSRGRLP